MRKGGRRDGWTLLTLFINDFITEIASSTTTGRHIAVTPLELYDTLCRMYSCVCVWGCEGERKRGTWRDNVTVTMSTIEEERCNLKIKKMRV